MLSQALVAFTIEFDNEFEHLTSRHGATAAGGPWLVSLAMWANCMRFLPQEGQEVWRPLAGVVERRWRERFGPGEVERLREILSAVDRRLSAALPDFLPILGYGCSASTAGQRSTSRSRPRAAPGRRPRSRHCWPGCCWPSRSTTSVNRVCRRRSARTCCGCWTMTPFGCGTCRRSPGCRRRQSARRRGYLEKNRLITLEPIPGPGRGRQVRLTGNGLAAQRLYRKLLGIIEDRWEARFGPALVDSLRAALGALVGRLPTGLTPYPDGWRAAAGAPALLPRYPMVLHRGGFPDGS